MSEKFNRIAFVGKMHSGKTTTSDFLRRRGFEKFAFADPVKEVSAAMLSTFVNYMGAKNFQYDVGDINHMKGHPSIRTFLQAVGTELGRQWYGPEDIWINRFTTRLQRVSQDASIVVDDCRFVNESERLKKLGFVIIKLHRANDERVQSIIDSLKKQNKNATPQEISEMLEKILNHPSETEVDKIDYDFELASLSLRALERIATIVNGENPIETIHHIANSDLFRDSKDPLSDIPIGIRAYYAHN